MTLVVRTLAATFYNGHHIESHEHPWGQLIFAAQGVMRVQADNHIWVIPPQRALWAPPQALHEIWARGDFQMRTLYIAPQLCKLLPAVCHGIDIAPFLRELILYIVRLEMLDNSKPRDRRLISVLIDQLAAPEILPLCLAVPRDRRARLVADRLQNDPADDTDLKDLAQAAGASARTLQRLFVGETGLRFVEWRRRLRLLHAASLISTGSSVAESGLEVGYQSTSAFVAAFRTELGYTPTQIRALRNAETMDRRTK